MTDARQTQLFAPASNGLFLVAVRRDGARSHVERFAEFDAMMDAGKQWCHNDATAWVSLNVAGGKTYPPEQTHLLVRRGDEVIVREQDARLDRVRRATKTRSRDTDRLG